MKPNQQAMSRLQLTPMASIAPLHPQYLAQLTTATPSSVNGKLDSNSEKDNNGDYFNVHTLEGKAGQQITIDLTSSDFDPILILLDSEDNRVGADDDGGEWRSMSR